MTAESHQVNRLITLHTLYAASLALLYNFYGIRGIIRGIIRDHS